MSHSHHEHHPVAQATAVLVGAAITCQSRVNGELSYRIDAAWQTALVSFLVGLTAVVLVATAAKSVRTGLRQVMAALRSGRLKFWQIIGGTLGALFVAVQSVTVPLTGVAVFTIAIVAAQTSASLLVDRLGVGPQGVIRPTRNRLLAAGIAVLAVGLAVADRIQVAGFPVLAVAAALVVGAAIAFQHSMNALVRETAGSSMTAALLNFIFGSILLIAGFAAGIVLGVWQWQPLPLGPWWLYTGGLFGVLFIATAAQVIRRLGSLRFTLGSVAGQLAASLAFDVWWPTAGTRVGFQVIAGVAVTLLAVGLANLRPNPTR